MPKETFQKNISIKNRRAAHEYYFLETYTCGMVLQGTEIKSIRQGKVNMQEAFAYFKNGELWVKQLQISAYTNGGPYNHVPDRERKLLLMKKEVRKLEAKSQEQGLTLIPVRLFINDKGLAKIEIALARGKKLFDKRETIKERDTKRELQRLKL
ncbi:MAG: SsrA-binding protein SmpB [Microscillaceae bacterium]|nr:SsrA-binding protein SmpB [Microscillaceae bacterium]